MSNSLLALAIAAAPSQTQTDKNAKDHQRPVRPFPAAHIDRATPGFVRLRVERHEDHDRFCSWPPDLGFARAPDRGGGGDPGVRGDGPCDRSRRRIAWPP